MEGVQLFDWQVEALHKMKNGCILNGGVGSGKSRTGIGYYYILNGGEINTKKYVKMTNPTDLYIITTARKRDTGEWDKDLKPYGLSVHSEINMYKNKVIVDSWNNIGKYYDVKDAFFIFDEQRVVGYGKWSATFIEIAKHNGWILLSATPGDTWMDFIPVFIANGFYKNKTDFCNKHVIYSRYTNYPKVDKFFGEGRLIRLKKEILIDMDFQRKTVPHKIKIYTEYDKKLYSIVDRQRWNPYKEEPIKNAGEWCLCLRRVVNSSDDRKRAILDIVKEHPKAIIFYTFDYELEILREIFKNYPNAEWNGHKHQDLPDGDEWVYFVEYIAGNEGWNCITTDTIIFYSQNYSYKVMTQAAGRIDRLNTPYTDLYYYHLMSMSNIDRTIARSLACKKKFNENKYYESKFGNEKEKEYYAIR